MVKIITWNIARRDEAWRALLDSDADIALLQEATPPPSDIAERIDVNTAVWQTAGAGRNRPWRTAIVKLSKKIQLEWFEGKSIENACPGEFVVSRLGSLTAARVTAPNIEPFIVASMYATWEEPNGITEGNWVYADASAHRLVSDLSAFIGRQTGHRIITAGDLNILHGYGENGSAYWKSRYDTIFSRMESLGLAFIGPQAPDGRLADPWPDELPLVSKNVPTYYTTRQTPVSATRQLDFVFASKEFAKQISVGAVNDPDQWGPSDHCRVAINLK